MDIREIVLRRSIPVWINSFNQPTYLRNIIGKFLSNGFRNIYVLDNQSDSPQLNQYYLELAETCPNVMVLYYNANVGPWYFFSCGMYKTLNNGPLLYTDPDIDFDVLAENFTSRLLMLSEALQLAKIGCALEIPSRSEMKAKFDYETQMEHHYWRKRIADDVYEAPVDTTLHLFNPEYFKNFDENFFSGVRVAGEGFCVRHLPWYANDPMPDDEYAYYKSRDAGYSHC